MDATFRPRFQLVISPDRRAGRMRPEMLQRLPGPLAYLRPRSLARTRRTVDELVADTRELRQEVRALIEQKARNGHGAGGDFADQLGAIRDDLSQIRSLLATLTEQQ